MALSPVKVAPGLKSQVANAGVSVQIANAYILGGFVTNPASGADQGLTPPQNLYVSIAGPAVSQEAPLTVLLPPGETLHFPAQSTSGVWVNSQFSGHQFSAVQFISAAPITYTPITGSFPPTGPTTMQNVIPSYLYAQYTDDPNLQSFVDSQNNLAQQFINTLNGLNLPIYTQLSESLLDWVAQGVYGIQRPYLNYGTINQIGAFNTYGFDQIGFNESETLGEITAIPASDDIFKRVITWHVYKGDGKVFNVRWLKRRIMRFINGADGTAPNIDNTYQVSVSFGLDYQVNITIVGGFRRFGQTSQYDTFGFNSWGFNDGNSTFINLPPLNSAALVECLETGVLELPFQFTYVIIVT